MQESFAKWRGEPLQACHGAHEGDADARHVSVRWLAKLVVDKVSELCVVHDICATTLIAEIFAPRTVGEELRVELTGAPPLHATVVRASDADIELRFADPVDVAQLIASQDGTPAASPGGPPRPEISCRGWLALGADTYMIEVCELSQDGARIAADVAPALGQHAQLAIPGLAPIAGEIRWLEEGRFGLAFDEPIPFDTLAAWIVTCDAQIGSHGQSRRWPRHSILLKTAARLGDVAAPVEAIVHNISRGGALISCRRGLHRGDEVELAMGPAGQVAGRVAWVGDRQAGVEFARTIDAEHVLHPLGGRSVPLAVHRYPTGRRPALHSHRAHAASV